MPPAPALMGLGGATATRGVLSGQTYGVSPSDPLTLAATLGHDTLSFEQYRHVGDSITGDWVTLYGGIISCSALIPTRPCAEISSRCDLPDDIRRTSTGCFSHDAPFNRRADTRNGPRR